MPIAARHARSEHPAARREMPRLEEVGQIAQGAGLPAEQLLQLGQLKGRALVVAGEGLGDQQLPLDPLQRLVELPKGERPAGRAEQANLAQVALHLEAAGQAAGDVGEDQVGADPLEAVLDLLEDMGGGQVEELDPPHAQDHVSAGADLRLERQVELVGGAEEQAALKLDDHRLAAVAQQDGEFLVVPHDLRELFAALDLAVQDRAPDLCAQIQTDGQHDADARGGDQAYR